MRCIHRLHGVLTPPHLSFALAGILASGGIAGAARAAEPDFVYAARTLRAAPPAGRTAPVEVAESGRLILRKTSGASVQQLVLVDATAPNAPEGTPVDVMDPDVSYDASHVVFSGFVQAESAWRIFEIAVDGTTGRASGLRQITHSDRHIDLERFGAAASHLMSYDDLDPCYLPDGRICFVSTRYPGIAPDNRVRATNLFVMNADGSDLHRITTERFGADTPAVDPVSGNIVYSRWWRTAQSIDVKSGVTPEPIPPGSPGYGNVDPGTNPAGSAGVSRDVLRGVDPGSFPGVNSWFLATIAPDGTGLEMRSGFRIDREQTQAYRPTFFANGDALALFIPRTPLLGFPGSNGLRRFTEGAFRPTALGGPQSFAGVAPPLPGFPGGVDGNAGPMPPDAARGIVYQSAVPLDDGTILASASVDGMEFDLYIQNSAPNSPPQRVAGNAGIAELDATPFVARHKPPTVEDHVTLRMSDNVPLTVEDAKRDNGTFTFRCENVHFNGPVGMEIATAPPVGKRLSIEFYMVPQRTSFGTSDPPLLIDSKEIGPDGSVEAVLPAGVPLFELLRRPDDSIALGRDGQIFHVGGMNFGEANQKARCVGCHAGHSMLETPEDATWTNLASSAVVTDGSKPISGPIDAAVDPAGRQGQPFFTTTPQALVDRSIDAFVGEWRAVEVKDVYQLTFRWSIPISAKDIVVRGPSNRGADFEKIPAPVVQAFTVATYLGEARQESVQAGEATASGAHVPVSVDREFDRMVITIRRSDVADPMQAFPGPVLAEVEVLARATAANPVISFIRGDANCDSLVNLTDAIAILGGLFQGQSLCCAAASDANGDDHLSLTDAISLLGNLFSGADPLPFPNGNDGACNRVEEQTLVCNKESCF